LVRDGALFRVYSPLYRLPENEETYLHKHPHQQLDPLWRHRHFTFSKDIILKSFKFIELLCDLLDNHQMHQQDNQTLL
jgi:hypothetical protein